MSDNQTTADAYRAFLDAQRRPQEVPPGEPAAWLIRYADQDAPDEIFDGDSAEQFARRRFDDQRGAWSIRLFQEVARG
jgi:predicted RNA polymerase sigma factor